MWEEIHALLLQSSDRTVTAIANFLPGLVALLAVLLATISVAVVVRLTLRRFFRGIAFDERIVRCLERGDDEGRVAAAEPRDLHADRGDAFHESRCEA